jgi:hypothetical protein
MKMIQGNIWDYKLDGYVVVPTNGIITKAGEAVMGRGLAWQAKKMFPALPKKLARHLLTSGNVPGYFHEYSIITFPVKHHWKEAADLKLIKRSAQLLDRAIDPRTLEEPSAYGIDLPVYMPKVGCGNGQLEWEQVRPILETYCPNVTIVDWR